MSDLPMCPGTAKRFLRNAVGTVFSEAAMAYDILARSRALNGLRQGHDGRYLAVRDCNQIERQTLKTCFRIIEGWTRGGRRP